MAITRASAKAGKAANARGTAPDAIKTVQKSKRAVSKPTKKPSILVGARRSTRASALISRVRVPQSSSLPATRASAAPPVAPVLPPTLTAPVTPASPTVASLLVAANATTVENTAELSKRTRDSQGRPPRKGPRRDYTDIITVIAGTGRSAEEFKVHEDRICRISPFFEAACSKNWLEGQTGIVRLPTQTAKDFRQYIEWVYSGKIELEEVKEHLRKKSTNAAGEEPSDHIIFIKYSQTFAHRWCKLWIMADFLGDFACKKLCIEKLAHLLLITDWARLFSATVSFVVANTSEDSTLYRWMIDSLTYYAVSTKDSPSAYRTDYFADLPLAVKDKLMFKAFALAHSGAGNLPGRDAGQYLEQSN